MKITDLIPQRSPFLFVDKVVERKDKTITTQYLVKGTEEFFKGHFPGNPIMPGVILQEAIFQSGAALMAQLNQESGLGVVTRVQNAKFKNMVKPGDLLDMEVELVESISNAHFMKGVTKVLGKTVLIIEFAVASI
jgi:3-hydroxyacyl-[acyl-carrier-protein] dehydratase